MEEQESELGANTPSLEDRIAEKLNLSRMPETDLPDDASDELPADDPDGSHEADEAQLALEEVEYEGKVYKVPTELKNGLMSKSDYTKKTQEIARVREAVELKQRQIQEFHEQQSFEATLQEEIGQIGTLNYQLKQLSELDWSKLAGDDLMRAGMRKTQLEEQRKQLIEAVNGKREKFGSEQKVRMQELLTKATEVLQRSIPGWGEATAAEVSDYALSKGFTSHEVNHIVNPRDVEILWKAQQYDKLVSTKEQNLRKAAKAPPVVKPGSVKQMPKDVREKLDFLKQKKKATNSQEMAIVIRKQLERKHQRNQ